jgi:septum formation protein
MPKIILASTSPRRKQLLGLLKIKFKIVDSGYKEVLHKHLAHEELVKYLALGKAQAAAKLYTNAIIIAADTLVSFKGKSIGKPKSKQEAFLMLKSFSGKKQIVYSAAVVFNSNTKQILVGCDKAQVYFKKLSEQEINSYLTTGEYKDRAGGYGAQDRGFNLIEKIEGNITTWIGMPMEFVYNALQKLGVKI